MLASCKSCEDPPTGAVDAASESGAAVEPASLDGGTLPDGAAELGTDGGESDAAGEIDEPFGDAGTSACRLVYGPAEQPFRGPAALTVVGRELRLVANDAGKPRI